MLKILGLLFIFSTTADAYIDPASGGVIFQILAAVGVFFAIMWRRIRRLLIGKKKEQNEIDQAVKDLIDNDSKKEE